MSHRDFNATADNTSQSTRVGTESLADCDTTGVAADVHETRPFNPLEWSKPTHLSQIPKSQMPVREAPTIAGENPNEGSDRGYVAIAVESVTFNGVFDITGWKFVARHGMSYKGVKVDHDQLHQMPGAVALADSWLAGLKQRWAVEGVESAGASGGERWFDEAALLVSPGTLKEDCSVRDYIGFSMCVEAQLQNVGAKSWPSMVALQKVTSWLDPALVQAAVMEGALHSLEALWTFLDRIVLRKARTDMRGIMTCIQQTDESTRAFTARVLWAAARISPRPSDKEVVSALMNGVHDSIYSCTAGRVDVLDPCLPADVVEILHRVDERNAERAAARARAGNGFGAQCDHTTTTTETEYTNFCTLTPK